MEEVEWATKILNYIRALGRCPECWCEVDRGFIYHELDCQIGKELRKTEHTVRTEGIEKLLI